MGSMGYMLVRFSVIFCFYGCRKSPRATTGLFVEASACMACVTLQPFNGIYCKHDRSCYHYGSCDGRFSELKSKVDCAFNNGAGELCVALIAFFGIPLLCACLCPALEWCANKVIDDDDEDSKVLYPADAKPAYTYPEPAPDSAVLPTDSIRSQPALSQAAYDPSVLERATIATVSAFEIPIPSDPGKLAVTSVAAEDATGVPYAAADLVPAEVIPLPPPAPPPQSDDACNFYKDVMIGRVPYERSEL